MFCFLLLMSKLEKPKGKRTTPTTVLYGEFFGNINYLNRAKRGDRSKNEQFGTLSVFPFFLPSFDFDQVFFFLCSV